MNTEKATTEKGKFAIFIVMARLLWFVMAWVGIYHIYTTLLDTNWAWWLDALMSGLAACNMFSSKKLRDYFFNVP